MSFQHCILKKALEPLRMLVRCAKRHSSSAVYGIVRLHKTKSDAIVNLVGGTVRYVSEILARQACKSPIAPSAL